MPELLRTYMESATIREENNRTVLDLPARGTVDGVVIELDENDQLGSFELSMVLLHFKRLLEAHLLFDESYTEPLTTQRIQELITHTLQGKE
jgi:hypothetical protein